VDFHHVLLASLPAHSHTVAVEDGCTKIPLSAAGAQAGETNLFDGFKPWMENGSSTWIRQN
jgi:hypothetical protein